MHFDPREQERREENNMSTHKIRCILLAMSVVGALTSSCRSPNSGSAAPAIQAPLTTNTQKSPANQTDSPPDKIGAASFPENANCPSLPGPMIQIQPMDLTSSIEKSSIRVGVDNLGRPVGESLLAQLAQTIEFVEWPEMNAVPFSTTAQDATGNTQGPNGNPRFDQAYIQVVPQNELSDRWYAVRVRQLPAGIGLPKYAKHETLPDGSIGARFSPGSHPTLTTVRVCNVDDPEKSSVTVEFSERVAVTPDISKLIAIGSGPSSCVLEFDFSKMPPAPSARFLRFACSRLAPSATVDLSISDAIKSPSGGGLERVGVGGARIDHRISGAELGEWAENCRAFKLKE